MAISEERSKKKEEGKKKLSKTLSTKHQQNYT
jgi:hypothetical protein